MGSLYGVAGNFGIPSLLLLERDCWQRRGPVSQCAWHFQFQHWESCVPGDPCPGQTEKVGHPINSSGPAEHLFQNEVWVSTVRSPGPPRRPSRVVEWSTALTPLSARLLVRLEMPALEMWLRAMEEESGP